MKERGESKKCTWSSPSASSFIYSYSHRVISQLCTTTGRFKEKYMVFFLFIITAPYSW